MVDRHVRILRPDPQGNEAEAELSLETMTLQFGWKIRGRILHDWRDIAVSLLCEEKDQVVAKGGNAGGRVGVV